MTRIGVALGGLERRPLDELARLARVAEGAGYELLLVPEAWGREAIALLGYLAARTSRIRLGTGIVNVYSRTPALLAMAAATLDELSGGRFVLGLGVSGRAVVEGWHGVAMARPLRRLRETTEAVRALLRRDRRGYEGELVRVARGFLLRVPRAREDLAIFHACLAPAAIRQCAEVADGWLPFFATPESLARDLALVRDGLAASGRARGAFAVAPFVPAVVADDSEAARAAVKRHVAFYVGGMGRFYAETLRRHGHADVVERVIAAWRERRRDEAAAAIPDALIDALALCGDRAAARARLAAYREAGADLPVIAVPEEVGLTTAEATLVALA